MIINNVNINYINYGNKKGKTIIFLHGWGQNIAMMKPLSDLLSKDYNIIVIDLPGHGQSDEPKEAWFVDDYADAIHNLLYNLKVKNPIFVGHSFGGKISLLYASKYQVDRLVVLGSPFKVDSDNLSFKTKVLKSLKKIPFLKSFEEFAKKRMGSTDYRNATPMMREILVNTVNYDISKQVKNIKAPTLIVWGSLDEAVPVSHAKELESLISDAGLVVLEGASHYAYLEHTIQVANMIKSLAEGEK